MAQGTVNRAALLSSFNEPIFIVERSIPEAELGTVVIKVLASGLAPYAHLIHKGEVPQLNLELPVVPNPSAIGRVHSIGPDAVRLREGDLVYVDGLIRGRDDPAVGVMPGHMNDGRPESKQLARNVWRDGSLQQYQKVPLETCFPLDEERLCNQLGYDAGILHSIALYTVAAGALLEAADLKVAETVIIGPCGGLFGGVAVELALAVGANVVALGRSEEKLAAMRERLRHPRLSTVKMTGDVSTDNAAILKATPNGAGAEVFNDWTPGVLPTSPYFLPAVMSLKQAGRVVLSGGAHGGLEIPYGIFLTKCLKLIGKWMCERRTVEQVINMVADGQLKIGKESGTEIRSFTLDEHEEAVEHARKNGGWRNYTVVAPNST
ncbi:alcohol dehydrogenase [Colletotrichum trifolii]|uniref:Alcohol dehydrogenase n=1 Tax=Colletotrichum trifolii TaxID=5466 RepID=A0A4R8QMK6_COLTR|nr:alcohol dehydrogenase [Colletotrichum trifolii]